MQAAITSSASSETPNSRHTATGYRFVFNWIAFVLFISLALLIASRRLYAPSDDTAYMNYFEGQSLYMLSGIDTWWQFIIGEPLWMWFAVWLGGVIGAEDALRLTIFVSCCLFLFSTTRLVRGAWLLVLLVFIFDRTLSTLMFYGQLRQGLALAVFLALFASRIPMGLAAAVAALLHTSFLFVMPFALAAPYLLRDRIYYTFLACVAVGTLVLASSLGNLDLGRRASSYEMQAGLQGFTLAFMVVQYAVTLYLSRPAMGDDDALKWRRFTVAVVLGIGLLTPFFSGADRFVHYASVFTAISVGKNLNAGKGVLNVRGLAAAVLWVGFLSFIDYYLSIRANFHEESWLGIWAVYFQ